AFDVDVFGHARSLARRRARVETAHRGKLSGIHRTGLALPERLDHARCCMNIRGFICAAWFVLQGQAFAECVAPPPPAPEDVVAVTTVGAAPDDETVNGATRAGGGGRVVAPISVNGQGPFRFIVDTGANRSVLSQALSDQLGLTVHGSGE